MSLIDQLDEVNRFADFVITTAECGMSRNAADPRSAKALGVDFRECIRFAVSIKGAVKSIQDTPSAQADVEAMVETCKAKDAEIQGLKQSLGAASNFNLNLNEMLAKSKSRNIELADIRANQDEEIKGWVVKCQDLEQSNKKAWAESRRLLGELRSADTDLDLARKELGQANVRITNLGSQVSDLTEYVGDKAQKLKDANAFAGLAVTARQKLEAELAGVYDNLKAANSYAEKAVAELIEREDQLAKVADAISDRYMLWDSMPDAIKALKAKADRPGVFSDYWIDLQVMNILGCPKDKMVESIKALKAKEDRLEFANSLRLDIENIRKAIGVPDGESHIEAIKALKNQLADAVEQLGHRKATIESYELAYSGIRSILGLKGGDDTRKAILDLKASNIDLSSQIEVLSKSLDESTAVITDQTDTIDSLSEQVDSLEATNAFWKRVNDSFVANNGRVYNDGNTDAIRRENKMLGDALDAVIKERDEFQGWNKRQSEIIQGVSKANLVLQERIQELEADLATYDEDYETPHARSVRESRQGDPTAQGQCGGCDVRGSDEATQEPEPSDPIVTAWFTLGKNGLSIDWGDSDRSC